MSARRGTVSRLVMREHAEPLRGVGQRERKDQPVWLGGGECGFGGGSRSTAIPERQVRGAREQLGFNEGEACTP